MTIDCSPSEPYKETLRKNLEAEAQKTLEQIFNQRLCPCPFQPRKRRPSSKARG